MIQWIQMHQEILTWLTAVSTITLAVSLILVPFFIVRIPSDYFVHGRYNKKLWAGQHLAVRGLLVIAKNLLGYIFVVAGLFMLVLPGQGLLTILIGIMLLDFRGKHELEKWIVSRRPVLRSINWIRLQAGKPPLTLEG